MEWTVFIWKVLLELLNNYNSKMKLKHLPTHFQMKIWLISLNAFVSLIIVIVSLSISPRKLSVISKIDKEEARIFDNKSCIQANDTRLLRYILRKHIFPPSPKPYNLTVSEELESLDVSSEIMKQELLLFKKIGIVEGFFVEYRAFDGVLSSHSLQLEINANWSGLLIEPVPDLFQSLKKRHRLAWLANLLVCAGQPRKDKVTFAGTIDGNMLRWKNEVEVSHHKFHEGNPAALGKNKNTGDDGGDSYKVVECFPLYSILRAIKVSEVDLLVLRFEGFDFRILESFPFDELNIKIITVEFGQDDEVSFHLEKILKKNGYEVVFENSLGLIFLSASAVIN